MSWWNTALVRADQEATLALQALDAERLATAITSRREGEALLVDVACGATPPVEPVPDSWGYGVLPPPGLGLAVAEGVVERSPPVALTAGRDPFMVVEQLAALAGAVSGTRRWTGRPVTGWESWYHYGLLVDREQFVTNARLLRERFDARPGFDLAQLDDGWQVTYGAWSPNDRFPSDLAELTGEVRALGCWPGLWLAPFMVQPGAPGLARDHPGWMIHGDDGQPLADRHGRWGLDASNPEVCAWLRELGARVRAWGFEMVKLDFLYLAAVEGGRHDAEVTGTEALRRGLRPLVDGLGDDVYVLACGAPMLPVVGLCHGNRVGHDLAVPVMLREFGQPLRDGWTGFQGVRPQARNVAARWAVHHRWFDCDPDVVMAWGSALPPDQGGYSVDESRTLATMAALCGGPFVLADDLARFPTTTGPCSRTRRSSISPGVTGSVRSICSSTATRPQSSTSSTSRPIWHPCGSANAGVAASRPASTGPTRRPRGCNPTRCGSALTRRISEPSLADAPGATAHGRPRMPRSDNTRELAFALRFRR